MAVYLRIAPDRVSQYDYGYDITGEAYENVRMTRPHDLEQYDTVSMKYSRQGADRTSIYHGPVDVVGGAEGGHRFTWRIPEGVFWFHGLFHFYLTLGSVGLSRTTLPARLLVLETAVTEADVS